MTEANERVSERSSKKLSAPPSQRAHSLMIKGCFVCGCNSPVYTAVYVPYFV